MTDLPPHLDDEQLSALLDGEGDEAERAHVEGCRRCSARLDAFTGVAAAVGAPPPPPSDEQREAAVARALDALPSPPVVRPLHRPGRAGPPAWLVAAAVVLVGVLALPLLASLGGGSGDDDQAASSAEVEAPESAGGAPAHAGDGSAEDAASEDQDSLEEAEDDAGSDAGSGGESASDLGAVTPGDDVRSRLDASALAGRRSADEAAPSASTTTVPAAPCEAEVRVRRPGLGPLQATATATADGVPALVLAFPEAIAVVRAEDCGRLFEQ